ncbi:unnamed protein product, partial [Rotaria socialis]
MPLISAKFRPGIRRNRWELIGNGPTKSGPEFNWTILIYFILFHGIKSKRLNKIIHDPIFTSNLNFVKWSANKFHNKLTSNFALNRFRLQILPDISIKVKWFYLEPSSAKSILRAADYPNLYVLGLYNINEKTARRLFT